MGSPLLAFWTRLKGLATAAGHFKLPPRPCLATQSGYSLQKCNPPDRLTRKSHRPVAHGLRLTCTASLRRSDLMVQTSRCPGRPGAATPQTAPAATRNRPVAPSAPDTLLAARLGRRQYPRKRPPGVSARSTETPRPKSTSRSTSPEPCSPRAAVLKLDSPRLHAAQPRAERSPQRNCLSCALAANLGSGNPPPQRYLAAPASGTPCGCFAFSFCGLAPSQYSR
jgi:hypothetical protein